MKRIYICGPISGRSEQEYKYHFDTVQTSICQRAKLEGIKFNFTNPITFPCQGMAWEDALKYCIKQLVDCDGIAVLQGWEHSRGCLLELEIAGRLKIPVVYIEPPVDECGVAEFSDHALHSDIVRYYRQQYFRCEEDLDTSERAGDNALLKTANRYLDPHGFEYIDIEKGK